jgi:uncharacterized membrane protein YesL
MIGWMEHEGPIAQDTCPRKLWRDLWTNLTGLLGANLIFLGWCAPSALATLLQLQAVALLLLPFTVGPALVGLFTYAGNVTLDRAPSFWRDSLRGFRSGFGAGVILSGVAIIALSAHSLALSFALTAAAPVGSVLLWSGQVAILLMLALTSVHLFSLIGLYRQGVREAFRNAVLLALGHPAPTVGLVGTSVLALLVARALSWGPLVIVPALLAMLAANTTLMLVKRHRVEWPEPAQGGEHRSIALRGRGTTRSLHPAAGILAHPAQMMRKE